MIVDNPDPSAQNQKFVDSEDVKLALAGMAQSASTINITFASAGQTDGDGAVCQTFPEGAKTAFKAAASIWTSRIVSTVPITIFACWSSLGDADTLGYSGSGGFFRNFSGAPVANVWYTYAMANAFAGTDLDTSSYDDYITYNSNFSWYYGVDGNPPSDKHDLVSVALHEMAHGLGFAGSGDYSSGAGTFGYGTGYPNIYDTFLENYSGTKLTNYTNPSTSMGTLFTSNNLWFDGTNADAANNGNRVKIYAPSSFDPGSSLAHLDMSTFYGTSNSLMVYAIGSGSSQHNPGVVTLGIFKDLGWTVVNPTVAPSLVSPSGQVQTLTPTFQWNTVTDAASYILTVTNVDTSTTVVSKTLAASTYCPSSTCSYTSTTSLANGKNYQFTIAGVDKYGDIGATSSAMSFYVDMTPDIPSLIGPEGRIKTLTPTFQWNKVSNATSYLLIVENATTGAQIYSKSLSTSLCNSTTGVCTFNSTTALTNGVYYDFTVEGVNTYATSCGEYFQFNTDLTLDPPTLANPSGIISTRKPTFTWNPVSGATGYELKITNTDTDTVTQDISVATSYCPSGTCSYPLSSALTDVNGTNYSFTVATKNSYGPGTFATPVAFQLGIIPGPTTMVYPIGDITTHSIVFKWNGVADATYYILKVTNTDTSSTSTLSFGVSCTSGICSAPATMIEQGNNYSVIIAAQNDFGQSAFSTPVTYHITVPYLPTPTLLSPVGTSASLTPAFRWDEVEEATNYKLVVTDANSSEIINSTFDTSICSNEICQFIPSITLTAGATYHISLQSIKGSYYGTVVTSSFVAQNSTTPPTLISPSGTITDDNPKF